MVRDAIYVLIIIFSFSNNHNNEIVIIKGWNLSRILQY